MEVLKSQKYYGSIFSNIVLSLTCLFDLMLVDMGSVALCTLWHLEGSLVRLWFESTLSNARKYAWHFMFGASVKSPTIEDNFGRTVDIAL